jgi:hypothetical protein
MNLVFILCSTKAFGERQIDRRRGARTKLNHQLNCQAYICKSYAEFEELQEHVKKPGKGLWCLVREQLPDGTLVKPTFEAVAPVEVPKPVAPIEPIAPLEPAPSIDPPAPPPSLTTEELTAQVVASVKERAKKLAELAAQFGVDAATLKPLIAESKEIRLKQGGWVGLKD